MVCPQRLSITGLESYCIFKKKQCQCPRHCCKRPQGPTWHCAEWKTRGGTGPLFSRSSLVHFERNVPLSKDLFCLHIITLCIIQHAQDTQAGYQHFEIFAENALILIYLGESRPVALAFCLSSAKQPKLPAGCLPTHPPNEASPYPAWWWTVVKMVTLFKLCDQHAKISRIKKRTDEKLQPQTQVIGSSTCSWRRKQFRSVLAKMVQFDWLKMFMKFAGSSTSCMTGILVLLLT